MPLYEARKTMTITLLVEAESPEEAKCLAEETPEWDWEEAPAETTVTVEEVEVPF